MTTDELKSFYRRRHAGTDTIARQAPPPVAVARPKPARPPDDARPAPKPSAPLLTDAELATLYARRVEALQATSRGKPLGAMDPAERAQADEASRIFNAADRAIVAELKRRMVPVRVGDVELRLTRDMLHLAECSPATGHALYADKPSAGTLYDYGATKAGRRQPACVRSARRLPSVERLKF